MIKLEGGWEGGHTFKSSTQEVREADLCEFKASLVYTVSQGYTNTPYLEKPKRLGMGKSNHLMIVIA